MGLNPTTPPIRSGSGVYRFRVRYDVCGTPEENARGMSGAVPASLRFKFQRPREWCPALAFFRHLWWTTLPSLLHMTRARLEVNRRLGCSLKARSTEWLYSTGKRARSELARPTKEKILLAGTQVYRHNPHDYTVGTGLVGATEDRQPINEA